MHNKKVLMHEFNGTDFDNILPQTTIDQVQNLQTTLNGKIADPETKSSGQYLKYNGTNWVAAEGGGGSEIPSGVIVMWSGASSAIPSGWYLCDGTNNTPNLVDRFIVGAGSTYAVGATGGEAMHTLSVSEMPSHSHDMNYSFGGTSGTYVNMYGSLADTRNTYSGIVVNTGGGQAHNNLPPYYALCYIMKG